MSFLCGIPPCPTVASQQRCSKMKEVSTKHEQDLGLLIMNGMPKVSVSNSSGHRLPRSKARSNGSGSLYRETLFQVFSLPEQSMKSKGNGECGLRGTTTNSRVRILTTNHTQHATNQAHEDSNGGDLKNS